MKRVLLFATFSLLVSLAFAATPTLQWVRPNPDLQPYNFDRVRQLLDEQGQLYVCTPTSLGDDSDMSLSKYDPEGNLLWQRHFDNGANLYDEPIGFGLDAAGNVYMAGYGGYLRDIAVVKYSSTGDLLWQRSYAGPGQSDDIAAAAAVDKAGNVWVVGSQLTFDPTRPFNVEHIIMLGWNSEGPLHSTLIYGVYSFGSAVAVGSHNHPTVGFLFSWENKVYISNQEYSGWGPIVIQHDDQNNLYGSFTREGQVILVKHDPDDNPLWLREQPAGNSSEYAIRTDRKGVLLMESHYQDDGAYTRLWKYTADGSLRWSTTLPDASTPLQALAIGRRGEILLGVIPRPGFATRLLGLNQQGKIQWDIPAPAPGRFVAALITDDAGGFYVSGDGVVARYSTGK